MLGSCQRRVALFRQIVRLFHHLGQKWAANWEELVQARGTDVRRDRFVELHGIKLGRRKDLIVCQH